MVYPGFRLALLIEAAVTIPWLAFLLLLLGVGAASAKDCLQSNPAGVAVVTGAARAHFHGDPAVCPNRQAYCLKRAYVIGTDRVLTSGSQDGYTCVWALGKGATTSGWIETKRLRPETISLSPPSSAWEGTWESEGVQRIEVGPDRHGLRASAVSDWKSDDGYDENGKVAVPGRRHHAEFSGQLRAAGNHARLTDGACAANLTLLDAFLIVDDDASCGDGNTSLSGIYRRRP
jgi:hypothetical protein